MKNLEHEKRFDGGIHDFMDAYVEKMRQQNDGDFTVKQLLDITEDLLGAGTESSSTTICWAVLYLLHHLDIKTGLQANIDDVVPADKWPCLADRVKLPFVEAFIMEVLRISMNSPFGMPHVVLGEDDVIFEEYTIP